MAANKPQKRPSSDPRCDDGQRYSDRPLMRSVEWSSTQWANYVAAQGSQLRMLRLQDVAKKMAVHENTIRNLYDPDSDGFDPEFPGPVNLTNAPKARAKGFIEWEIESYLVLQVLRSRGLDAGVLDAARVPPQPTVTDAADHQPELKRFGQPQKPSESSCSRVQPSGTPPSNLAALLRNLWTPGE